MSKQILFVTGSDTGVGKTVFAAALTRRLRERGRSAAALKPLCSGGREDARILRAVAGNNLTLDEINPWHFRAPIAPSLAARKENKRVTLPQVAKHIRGFKKQFEILVVEGAGGLLSPLGESFDSRDLLIELNALPIVVCANRLGAINQVLLVLEALPKKYLKRSQVVLMSPQKFDKATLQNFEALQKFVDGGQLHKFPWLKGFPVHKNVLADRAVDDLVSKLFL